MKRVAVALLLSGLTLVGGHFFNRRWDRAVLLFVALSLWGIGSWVLTTGTVGAGDWTGAADLARILAKHWTILGVGLLVLWLASLGVTYWDARRPNETLQHHWSAGGVVAAVGLGAICAWMLITHVLFIAAIEFGAGGQLVEALSTAGLDKLDNEYNFQHHLHFGGRPERPGQFAKPPGGDGYLRGRFLYSGKPAEGISLRLTLNDTYETDTITTDVDGVFTVRIQPGQWRVNQVRTQGWKNKPAKGNFLIVSGLEPKLGTGRYNHYYWMEQEGKQVAVSDQPTALQMNFEIRDQVALTWPPPDKKRVDATASGDTISWEPYPGAHEYLLTVTDVKREGKTTSHWDVATRRIKGSTQLPLSHLESVASQSGEKEYQVTLLAFAEDGSFLSRSWETFRTGSFLLKDKKQFVADQERGFFDGPVTAGGLEELRENNRRIEAIEVLIKAGLVNEAERLYGRIQGRTDLGRKKAIAGYIAANRGKCEEANRLFAEALSEAGTKCVPEHYREKCQR